jgi:hypothetical protein
MSSSIDAAMTRAHIDEIRSRGYFGLITHASLKGSAFRVPADKVVVVLTAPGTVTEGVIGLTVMQSLELARRAERGQLECNGQPLYTRTFLPGEKVPDMALTFRDKNFLCGLFRLPTPYGLYVGDLAAPIVSPSLEWLEANFGSLNIMKTVNDRYARRHPKPFKVTLRNLLHDRRLPSGVYIIAACRVPTRGNETVLSKVQLLEFRHKYRALFSEEPGVVEQPRTKAELDAYSIRTHELASRLLLRRLQTAPGYGLPKDLNDRS